MAAIANHVSNRKQICMNRLKALTLLDECTGIDIWSVDHCRERGVPEDWIEELADAHESSFFQDRETIYYGDQKLNQYHGIHDLKLAIRLVELLGGDVQRFSHLQADRAAYVRALKEMVEEDL